MEKEPQEVEVFHDQDSQEIEVSRTLDRAIEFHTARLKKLMQLVLPQDWARFENKPYLTSWGAERIRRPLGIKLKNLDFQIVKREDSSGSKYEIVIAKADAEQEIKDPSTGKVLAKDEFPAVGFASTKDQFFITRKNEEGEKITLDPADVDIQKIYYSAYSDLVRNAVSRMMGLRNLTLEDLKRMGIDVSKIMKVEFRSGTKQVKSRYRSQQNPRPGSKPKPTPESPKIKPEEIESPGTPSKEDATWKAQDRAMVKILEAKGHKPEDKNKISQEKFGKDWSDLSLEERGKLIEEMQR